MQTQSPTSVSLNPVRLLGFLLKNVYPFCFIFINPLRLSGFVALFINKLINKKNVNIVNFKKMDPNKQIEMNVVIVEFFVVRAILKS